MIRNYLHPHYFHCLSKRLSVEFWSVYNRLSAFWWKVKLGRDVRFQGRTYFRTEPCSSISIGDNCLFQSNHASNLIGVYSPCMISTISRKAKITIGNNCGFSGTVIGAALKITFGDNVRCGANTMITDSDWHSDDSRTGKDAPVIIDDNVWLGYGVKVLKGVHIGKNSVIGAGSIVTKDIPANVIAAGNPCRVIKQIDYAK